MSALAVADEHIVFPSHLARPRKFTDAESFQAAVDGYFRTCDTEKRPYTVEGLAEALDTNRQTILEYEGRVHGRQEGTADERIADSIKRARARIQRWWAEQTVTREKQVAGLIFYGKNNFGYVDTQQVDHTHQLLAIGQPGAVPAALEPPVIDAQVVNQIAPRGASDALSLVPRSDLGCGKDG